MENSATASAATHVPEEPQSHNRLLLLVFPLLVLSVLELGIALPNITAAGRFFKADPEIIGFLFSIQYIGQFAMSPVWGWLSDRFGRKPMFIAALATGAVAEFVTAYASNLTVFIVGRLLVGLTAGNIAIGSALMSDMTTDRNRSKGMALVGISYGLGFVIGSPIGGATLAGGGDKFTGFLYLGLPYTVAGLVLVLSAILAVFMIPTPDEYADITAWNHYVAERRAAEYAASKASQTKSKLRDNLPFISATLMCLLYLGYATSISVMETRLEPLFSKFYHMSGGELGGAFAGIGLVMLFMQGSVSKIGRYVSDFWLILVGGVLGGIGYIIASSLGSDSFAYFYLFLCIACVGRGVFFPGILAKTSKCYDNPTDTGRVMGFLNSSGSLGRIGGPILGGMIVTYFDGDRFSPFLVGGTTFLSLTILWAILWLLATKLTHHHKEDLPV